MAATGGGGCEMRAPSILAMNMDDLQLAETIAAACGGTVEAFGKRIKSHPNRFDDPASHIRRLFSQGRPIVAIMAAGAVIRVLAPVIADKRNEPPVLAVAPDGSAAVPLLGGHRGANELARKIAAATGGAAAVTTAGDIKLGVALDAPPPGYRLGNRENAKNVMAALAAGESARLDGYAGWLANSSILFGRNGPVSLRVTERKVSAEENELIYHPSVLVLGMGCERGAIAGEAIGLAEQVLAEHHLARESLAFVASLDIKADEPAIHAVAEHFGVPARFFKAARLEAESGRLANPSPAVFAEVGCHGVAEGAALAGVGDSGELLVEKRKSKHATAAVGRAIAPIIDLPGKARGILFVVGIGPGGEAWRSPEATQMIERATDLVGYSLYLDLVAKFSEGKTRHEFSLGEEEKRVRHAMELAGRGRQVALVCSGDAGIYAMASLVFDLLDRGRLSDAARRIEIVVAPGISALQAAAARTGALLGHDFCAISLSDLLTPWKVIEKRIEAAASGDFVVALYNPVSRRRRTQLEHARRVLLQHRPADTPVVVATNLGRAGENVRAVKLAELDCGDVDMLTVVLVGSSQSRTVTAGDGRIYAYTPRGYDAKDGTAIDRGDTTEAAQ